MTTDDELAQAMARLESAFDNADLKTAEDILMPLLESDEDNSDVQVAYARVLAARDDGERALQILQAQLDADPDNGKARAYFGAVLVGKQAYGRAIPELQRAILSGGDVPSARQGLGIALLETGNATEALPQLQKAAAELPTSWIAWFYLGMCLGDLAQWDLSGAALAKSLTLKPDNVDAYEAFARVLVEQKKIDDAIAAIDDGIRVNPGADNLIRLKVQIFADFGKLEDAEAALRSIPADARNSEDLSILATLEMGKGKWADALRYARSSVDADPQSPRALYTLGLALEGQEPIDRKAAMSAYQQSVELGDPTGDAATRWGFMLLEDGAADDAIAVLEGARDRNNGAPGTLLNLGIAYLKKEQMGPAAELARGVLEHRLSTPGMKEQAERILKAAKK